MNLISSSYICMLSLHFNLNMSRRVYNSICSTSIIFSYFRYSSYKVLRRSVTIRKCLSFSSTEIIPEIKFTMIYQRLAKFMTFFFHSLNESRWNIFKFESQWISSFDSYSFLTNVEILLMIFSKFS